MPVVNPLQDGLRIEPTPGPTTLVIFGASGDLTKRKLLPAIYNLARGQRLPARFNVIGIGRSKYSDDTFRDQLAASLKEFAGVNASQDEVARSLSRRTFYLSGDLDEPELFERLKARLAELDADGVLYYLATPPTVYGD